MHWNNRTTHTNDVHIHGLLRLEQVDNRYMIHWNNKTALYEAMNICTIHEVDILRGQSLTIWINISSKPCTWPSLRHTNSWHAWICYCQYIWEQNRDATAGFNTLHTAAVAGPPRRPNKHPMETWHNILDLALSCHPCRIHLCFWHRKQLLSLIIPREQSQRQWWAYDTTGTVVTQTYFTSNSGDTNVLYF